jgi:hypothetical protein
MKQGSCGMIARLIALWFSVGLMCLTSASCYTLGVDYYHVYQWEDVELPLISRVFMTKSGWIYDFPVLFILVAALQTWKGRHRAEPTWCLVVINLGATILLLALFQLAIETPRIPGVPRMIEQPDHRDGQTGD